MHDGVHDGVHDGRCHAGAVTMMGCMMGLKRFYRFMLSRPPLDAMPNSMRSKSSSSHSSNVRDNGALEAGLVWFVLVGLGLAVVAVSILQLVVVCCISI